MNKSFLMQSVLIFILSFSFSGCKVNETTYQPDQIEFSFQGGANWGGIVENNIFEAATSTGIDAISGATYLGFNLGTHAEINVGKHQMETGLDYIYMDQSITYSLQPGSVNQANRDIQYGQLRIPLTYNFKLFRNSKGKPVFLIRPGINAGCTLHYQVENTGTLVLPDYDFYKFDMGMNLGFTVYPFDFQNGKRMGIYTDFYRGSQVFEDPYHTTEGMGGNSFIKFGLILHL